MFELLNGFISGIMFTSLIIGVVMIALVIVDLVRGNR